MVAGAFESALGKLFQQLVILGADAAEGFERLLGFAAGVVQIARPGVRSKAMSVGLSSAITWRMRCAPTSSASARWATIWRGLHLPGAGTKSSSSPKTPD